MMDPGPGDSTRGGVFMRSRHRALVLLISTLLLPACHGGSSTKPAGGLVSPYESTGLTTRGVIFFEP
jgi:hypothetical protein